MNWKNHVCTHLNVTRITKRTSHTPSGSTWTWRQTWPSRSRSTWNTCWKFVTRRPLLAKILFSVESHQFTIALAFTLCLTILERNSRQLVITYSRMERKQMDTEISMIFKLIESYMVSHSEMRDYKWLLGVEGSTLEPLLPQQPPWPQWPLQLHFIKKITDCDGWIIPGTKMTNTGLFLGNGL